MLNRYDGSPQNFNPDRRLGLVFHLVIVLLLAGVSAAGFFFSLNNPSGPYSILILGLAAVLLLPLPFFAYRLYALLRAGYRLERNGLQVRWGLRQEDIPLNQVEWIRGIDELGIHIPSPAFSTPGAILGKRTIADLGEIEFMASIRRHCLAIATPDKILVISPSNPKEFLRLFQQAMELGSLDPIKPQSVEPNAFLSQVWSDRLLRRLLLAGLALTILLFVVVAILIPNLSRTAIGFSASGEATLASTPAQLLLLPILAAICFALDALGAFYFYKRTLHQPISYLLGAASILTPILLLGSVILLVVS